MWGDGKQDKDAKKKAIPLEPDFTNSFSILQSKPYSPYLPGSVFYGNQPMQTMIKTTGCSSNNIGCRWANFAKNHPPLAILITIFCK
jgi:hypothetical protein